MGPPSLGRYPGADMCIQPSQVQRLSHGNEASGHNEEIMPYALTHAHLVLNLSSQCLVDLIELPELDESFDRLKVRGCCTCRLLKRY